jgi:Protein of unknown function (DUF2721)
MNNPVSLLDMASTIQSAIAPVFLLTGIGAMLNVISSRLSRAIDRTRSLEPLHRGSLGKEHARYVDELRLLDRRITLSNLAATLCVASALAVCLLIIMLFIAQLSGEHYANSVAAFFVIAMLLLAAGLLTLLLEIRIAIRALRVRAELLQHHNTE